MSRSATFPRRCRLTGSRAFSDVFKRRCSNRGPDFVVYAAPNGLDYARLGLAVSRRVARSAVARNRLKRRVREFFRHNQHQVSGLDLIVVAQPGAGAKTTNQLEAGLAKLWAQVCRKCKKP